MSSRTLSEAAFAALPVQVAVIDPNGVIVRTNRAWRRYTDWDGVDDDESSAGENYLEVCRDHTVGSTDDDRTRAVDGGATVATNSLDGTDGRAVADGLESVLSGAAETFEHEYACHSPEEQRWFLARVSGFTHGSETYAQVAHVDITERKHVEQRLEARNERLEMLADVLSHDLRNPLNVVLGRAEILGDRLDVTDGAPSDSARTADESADESDAVAADIASIRSSATRIEAIITDALQLARSRVADDGGPSTVSLRTRAETAWEHVDVDQATLTVADSFRFEAREGPLGQVFENLFRNAVDHVGPDVAVTVGSIGGDSGDGAVTGFYVADDGPGIPPADRDEVFEPGHSSEADGTGLGLAIVERFAESQDWYVSVVTSDDGGARFEVRGIDAA